MNTIKKTTAKEDLQKLIDFYSGYSIENKQLKKLIIMNLKALQKKLLKESE